MKIKRFLALTMAAAMALGMVGCAFSTPATVGTVGETEIPAGIYLALQLDAYSDAAAQVTDSSADVLDATITVDGAEVKGADYVADKTHEFVGDYAATLALYTELGGELTAEEKDMAKLYTDDMWASSSEAYKANGIGQASLQAYVEYTIMRQALLEMVYGPEGSQPVSDADLTAYITDNYRAASYISFPLLNYSTYTALDEEGDKTVTELAQAAADRVKAGEDAVLVASEQLPTAFELLGMDFSLDAAASSVGDTVFSPSQMASFGEDAKQQLMAAKEGDALVLDISANRMAMLLKPVFSETMTLDVLRPSALSEMKTADLDTLLAEKAEGMEWNLDDGAVKTYSAKNIELA